MYSQLERNIEQFPDARTLQGLLLEVSDVATAMWSFVIAVHTFFLIAGGRSRQAWVAEKSTTGKARWVICIGIWAFVVCLALIGIVLIQNIEPENGTLIKQSLKHIAFGLTDVSAG